MLLDLKHGTIAEVSSTFTQVFTSKPSTYLCAEYGGIQMTNIAIGFNKIFVINPTNTAASLTNATLNVLEY